ncbi:hypothetical protein Q1695_006130 [Nippostrongylus brasiliensis]|nr:hypothetical protein Q1695_006130 [Nippostrongylus brasiliensis]
MGQGVQSSRSSEIQKKKLVKMTYLVFSNFTRAAVACPNQHVLRLAVAHRHLHRKLQFQDFLVEQPAGLLQYETFVRRTLKVDLNKFFETYTTVFVFFHKGTHEPEISSK